MTTTSGTVQAREATIPLSVQDGAGEQHSILAVVDTGFTGYLVLPHDLIRQLRLTSRGNRRLTLADGSVQLHDFYGVSVSWHGQQQTVLTYGTGDKPLIGMRLLAGSRVTLGVVDGGAVTIEPLAA